MKVLARPGAKCPMEHKPRTYITDSTVVDVPDSTYYRRLLADGSLILEDTAPVAEQGGHD